MLTVWRNLVKKEAGMKKIVDFKNEKVESLRKKIKELGSQLHRSKSKGG